MKTTIELHNHYNHSPFQMLITPAIGIEKYSNVFSIAIGWLFFELEISFIKEK